MMDDFNLPAGSRGVLVRVLYDVVHVDVLAERTE
jgi:hypothetical protein